MMASNHICPYHAYHAACDHAHPVLRSVLCTLCSVLRMPGAVLPLDKT